MARTKSNFAIHPENIRLSRDPAHLLQLFSLLSYDVEPDVEPLPGEGVFQAHSVPDSDVQEYSSIYCSSERASRNGQPYRATHGTSYNSPRWVSTTNSRAQNLFMPTLPERTSLPMTLMAII